MLLTFVWSMGSAGAAVFNIPAGDANGLISAINSANANPGVHTINLGGGNYVLSVINNNTNGTNGLPTITSEIVVNGNGSIIRRSAAHNTPAFRIFHVAAQGQLTLNNVNIRGGKISNKTCVGGAGVLNDGGTITLMNTSITNNDGTDSGLNGCAGSVGGGGLRNVAGGQLTIRNSTIWRNAAMSNGGGISNSGTLTLINSTVAENVVSDTFQPCIGCSRLEAIGGGLYNDGTAVITNSTIVRNIARNDSGRRPSCNLGGGICHISTGQLKLTNTIVELNEGGNVDPHPGTRGHNLIDSIGDPGLGDFLRSDIPGQGRFPLRSNSPAIDAGDNTVCAAFPTDQLGSPRPADGNGDGVRVCDIGAVEFYPNVNGLVRLDSVKGTFFSPGEGGGPILPYAPAGTFQVNAAFTNTSVSNICNVAFEIVELTAPNVLLDHRSKLVGGAGTIANYPIALGQRHILSNQVGQFSFDIGLGTQNEFQFFVNMLGEPSSGSCPSSP